MTEVGEQADAVQRCAHHQNDFATIVNTRIISVLILHALITLTGKQPGKLVYAALSGPFQFFRTCILNDYNRTRIKWMPAPSYY